MVTNKIVWTYVRITCPSGCQTYDRFLKTDDMYEFFEKNPQFKYEILGTGTDAARTKFNY